MEYISNYSPEFNSTYINSNHASGKPPYQACDPSKSVTGLAEGNSYDGVDSAAWVAEASFHIDLGVSKLIKRIYYENFHNAGEATGNGFAEFTFWGSNSPTAFADLDYTHDTGWTQITTDVSAFLEHVASDIADPKYILLTNTTSFRYYRFKIANNCSEYYHASNNWFTGVRRLELQTVNPGVFKFLAHCNGEDNGTTFVDECGHLATRWGSPVTKQDIKKFGTAAFYSPDSTNYVTFASSPDFNLGTSEFGYATWVYTKADGRGQSLISRRPSAVPYGWTIYIGPDNKIYFAGLIGGSWYNPFLISTNTVTPNALHHIELDREGDNWYLFLDGNLEATTVNGGAVNDTGNALTIGSSSDAGEGNYYGYMDEVALFVGKALHTSAFTPPSVPYSLKKYNLYFPPIHDTNHVKATTISSGLDPFYATDPTKSLTGTTPGNAWSSANLEITNQRFHIDLGIAKKVEKIYYENNHYLGGYPESGVKNFTFWGSNSPASFAELSYGIDTGWTQLTTDKILFDKHIAADTQDPKYIPVDNTVEYRYYAFKFADNWGYSAIMGLRRLDLMVEDTYTSQYPLEHTIAYVKATNSYYANPGEATDPNKPLIGSEVGNCWSAYPNTTNQRFHIDLGSEKLIDRIYYENMHISGGYTNEGIKDYTFWGSNNPDAFNDLVYGDDFGPNVFVGGTASDDDVHNEAQYRPDKAVDGNLGTRWSTNGTTALPHWWKYDLGYTLDLCTDPEKAISDSEYSTYINDKGFNNSSGEGNQWGTNTYGDPTGIAWLGYDFGVGVTKAIRRVRVDFENTSYSTSVKIQYSNNGLDWSDAYTATGLTQTFNTIDIPESGSHRYWRVLANSNLVGGVYFSIYECEMMEFKTKIVTKVSIYGFSGPDITAFEIQASNDNSNWDTLYIGGEVLADQWNSFVFSNITAYRYYRIYITAPTNDNWVSAWEIQAFETGWTQLTTDKSSFDAHVPLNQPDPKYIYVTNTVPYRYYALKIANGYSYISVRRIELQTSNIAPINTLTKTITSDASVKVLDNQETILSDAEISPKPPEVKNIFSDAIIKVLGILKTIFSNAKIKKYYSQYPPEQNKTYIKTTTEYPGFPGYFSTDPTKSLIGDEYPNQWYSDVGNNTNQRFHIDLGSVKTIERIYYENMHYFGVSPEYGVKNFKIYGSNNPIDFDELFYGTTQLINGNFELYNSPFPNVWNLWGGSPSANVVREETLVHSGNFSLKLTSNNDEFTPMQQDISAKKGITYWQGKEVTLSCWVWADTPGVGGIFLHDGIDDFWSPMHTGDSTWQLLSVTATLNVSANQVTIQLATQQNATVYFDDVALIDESINVIGNSAFEDWSTAPTNWDFYNWASTSTVEKESIIIKDGIYSAKLTKGDADCSIMQLIDGVKGIEYWRGKHVTYGAWVWSDISNSAEVGIYDGISGVGTRHSGSGNWEYLTVTKTIDISATIVMIYCSVYETGTGYFDSCKVIEDMDSEVIYNGNCERWDSGDNVAPNGWNLWSNQETPDLLVSKESTIVHGGSYSIKLHREGGSEENWFGQKLFPDYDNSYPFNRSIEYWRGKTITFSIWVYASIANKASIYIWDGISGSGTGSHTGDSTWQLLTVTKTIAWNATDITVNLWCGGQGSGESASCYFDDAVCVNFSPYGTELTTESSTFEQHALVDAPDPRYILIDNSTPYRYYTLKFFDNYGAGNMSVRRIELQSDAKIQNITSDANIKTLGNQQIINSDSNIKVIGMQKEITSDAKIIFQRYITSDSIIKTVNNQQNITSDATIQSIIKLPIDTNFFTRLIKSLIVQTSLSTIINRTLGKITTKLNTCLSINNTVETNLSTRLTSYNTIAPRPLDSIIVYKDGIALTDVNYSTLKIQYNLNSTPSNATFTLARHHDDLDHNLFGGSSIITANNIITVYDGSILLFKGYIRRINANSSDDTVGITAEDIRYRINEIEVSLYYGGYNSKEIFDENITETIYNTIDSALIYVLGVAGITPVGVGSGFVPEPTYFVGKCGEIIDTLIGNSMTANWYTDVNEKFIIQKVATGQIKTLPLSGINMHRHIYDTVLNDITLNKTTSSYAKSLEVKLGKEVVKAYVNWQCLGRHYYFTRNLAMEWDTGGAPLNDPVNGQPNAGNWRYVDYTMFMDEKTKKDITTDLNYIKNVQLKGHEEPQIFATQTAHWYTGNQICLDPFFIWAPESLAPLVQVQYIAQYKWLDYTVDLPSISVGSGIPKKKLDLSQYGMKIVQNPPMITKQWGTKTWLGWQYEEAYDYTVYARDLANFELNQNNKLLTEASITLLLDAYEYYGINLSSLINLSNTTLPNIYNNTNGFPLNISGVTIDCATKMVTLNTSNYGKSFYKRTGVYGWYRPEFFIPAYEQYIPEEH